MKNSKREREILDILHDQGYASVEELADRIHISQSSIRRDLASLENKGIVQRSYGGVELLISDSANIPFKIRLSENRIKKKKIAETALSMIQNGSVIFCDGGSTTYYLIQLIPSIKGTTVVTNGVEALSFLAFSPTKTISTGGTVNPENRGALIGDPVVNSWKSMRADIAFFSVQAIDSSGNMFFNYESEVPCAKAMLSSAKTKILLCDSTKIGKTATYLLGTLSDIDIVICDKDISNKYSELYPNVKFIY